MKVGDVEKNQESIAIISAAVELCHWPFHAVVLWSMQEPLLTKTRGG